VIREPHRLPGEDTDSEDDMRRFVYALGLVLTAAATTACGNSSAAPDGRTLSHIEPLITKDLTPALARERIGKPDEEQGSGLILFVYRLDAGRTLWLSFPGYMPIAGARLVEANGTSRDLTLR